MNFLLDTNIILHYIRQSKLSHHIDQAFGPLSGENIPIISVVSIGEIQSLALQNKWGARKLLTLERLLNKFIIADINIQSILDRYSELDAFSQGKILENPLGTSARNMGKNDLWIAATASVLGATLLTTDQDFNHLSDKFLLLEKISL